MSRTLVLATSLLLFTSGCCCPPTRGRCVEPCPRPAASPPMVAPQASAPVSPQPAIAAEDLVLRVHDVADLVNDDPVKMERLLDKIRVWGAFPGGSVVADERSRILVTAPPRVQGLVENVLRNERAPLRQRYYDVKDLLGAHPALEADIRPLLGDVEGANIVLKAGTLIVKAPPSAHDAIEARLAEIRTAK